MANPVAQAVLLMQRLFWYPLIEDPSELGTRVPARHVRCAALITLVICVVLLCFAQRFFAALRRQVPGASLR